MDVAFKQPTYQTSVESDDHESSFSVDGDITTCACTKSETMNYYQVDLQVPFHIHVIVIVNTYSKRMFYHFYFSL